VQGAPQIRSSQKSRHFLKTPTSQNFFLKNLAKVLFFCNKIFHNVKFVPEDIEDTLIYYFFIFLKK